MLAKVCLAYWFQYLLETLLYQSIPNARNSQWAHASVGLWYVLPSYRFGSVASFGARNDILNFGGHFFGRQFADVRDCQFVRSGGFAPCVVLDFPVRQQNVFAT